MTKISLKNDFIGFIINPKEDVKYVNLNIKIRNFIKLIVFTFILLIFSAFLNVLLLFFGIVEPSLSNGNLTENILKIILIKVIATPVLEELSCRLYLVFSPLNLSVSLSCLCYYVFMMFYGRSIYDQDLISICFVGLSMVAGLTVYLFLSRKKITRNVSLFWKKHFKIIYYFTVLLFVLLHWGKYSFDLYTVLLIPFLYFPQIITGFAFGYARLKFGFFWCVIFHCLINIISVSPLIVSLIRDI
jgi:hypothetical protein